MEGDVLYYWFMFVVSFFIRLVRELFEEELGCENKCFCLLLFVKGFGVVFF